MPMQAHLQVDSYSIIVGPWQVDREVIVGVGAPQQLQP